VNDIYMTRLQSILYGLTSKLSVYRKWIYQNKSDNKSGKSQYNFELELISTLLQAKKDECELVNEQLEEREQWINNVMESSSMSVIGLDTNSNCIYCNQNAVDLLGFRKSTDLYDKLIESLFELQHTGATPRSYLPKENPVQLAIKHHKKTHIDKLIIKRHDGSEFDAEYWIFPISHKSAVIGAVITLSDVTEQNNIEMQLQQLRKMSTLGQLSIGISHDFNNLLTIISGNLELLLENINDDELQVKNPDKKEDFKEMLNDAMSATSDGTALISSLMEFSREEASQPKDYYLDISLKSLPRILSRIFDKSINLVFEIENNLPQVHVDKAQLDNALYNLTINARDAMPEGGTLTISAKTILVEGKTLTELNEDQPAYQASKFSPGTYVQIAITDDGEGMTSDTMSQVFKPFYATTRVSGSTPAEMYSKIPHIIPDARMVI